MPICDQCGAIGGYHLSTCSEFKHIVTDIATVDGVTSIRRFEDGQTIWHIQLGEYVIIKEARAGGLTVQDKSGDIFHAAFEEVRP